MLSHGNRTWTKRCQTNLGESTEDNLLNCLTVIPFHKCKPCLPNYWHRLLKPTIRAQKLHPKNQADTNCHIQVVDQFRIIWFSQKLRSMTSNWTLVTKSDHQYSSFGIRIEKNGFTVLNQKIEIVHEKYVSKAKLYILLMEIRSEHALIWGVLCVQEKKLHNRLVDRVLEHWFSLR